VQTCASVAGEARMDAGPATVTRLYLIVMEGLDVYD
jgi:hypothetical protein